MNKLDKENFIIAVHDIVRAIPYGQVTSYGAIAKAAGYLNMSRMVGNIMSEHNPNKNSIPAHRVVNSQGILSGKAAFGSSGEMQKLLESEGISIINDRIKNWKTVFWNPIDEIVL